LPLRRTPAGRSSKIFLSRSCIDLMKTESSFSRSRTTLAVQSTGSRAYKSANKLLEPTCETHAAQQGVIRREESMAEFRELPGLPAYGPMPLQFSSTGQGAHREGFVVEFLPDTDECWVGNFQPGLSSYSGVIAHPDGRRVVVVAGGEAYIVAPHAKKVEEMFGGAIEFAAFVSEIQALVF